MGTLVRISLLTATALLIFSAPLWADDPEKGNPTIDSLLEVIENHPSDSFGAKAYMGLAEEVLFDDPATCEKYCKQSLRVSKAAQWKSGIGNALGWLAYLMEQRGKVDSALVYYEEALALAIETNDFRGQGTVLNNMAAIYKDKGEIDKALGMYDRSLVASRVRKDSSQIATTYNNIGLIYQNQGQIDQALRFYRMCLALQDSISDEDGLASTYINVASLYREQGDFNEAMLYVDSSLKLCIKNRDIYTQGYCHLVIGTILVGQGKKTEALDEFRLSFDLRASIDDQQGMARCLMSIGTIYEEQDSLLAAKSCYVQSKNLFEQQDDKAGVAQTQFLVGRIFFREGIIDSAQYYGEHSLKNAQELGFPANIRDAAQLLADVFRSQNNWEAALKMNDLYIVMRDSVQNDETRKVALLNKFQSEYEKKEAVLKAQSDAKVHEQVLQRNAFIGGFILVALLAIVLYSRYRIKTAANKELNQKNLIISNEKDRSDKLLLNILPQYVANELKETGSAKAMSHDSATVMFTDFVDFTKIAEQLTPEELVSEINFCFSEFDRIISRYRIEKVKTIGDAYMCAGGIPQGYNGHPIEVVKAALEIREFMNKLGRERSLTGENCFRIRIGISTGPLVAGVVGLKKFAYDIWGDTVNLAARMESNGAPDKINVSQTTYELIKDEFVCEYRGEIEAKNKGKVKMYFVEKSSKF